MRDVLPRECEIRDYLLERILQSYRRWGFERLETPALERIEVLSGSKGGENEKLIFRVMKRGEKLTEARTPDEMVDSGLRYDLTVPLSRFVAENAAVLPLPFKALQVGPVWRAERPQKGRYRQFTQCDVDVIGLEAPYAEAELISATADCLRSIGLGAFTVKVNDRRLLWALCAKGGYAEGEVPQVLIALDKHDKVGLPGVVTELEVLGADRAATFGRLLEGATQAGRGAGEFDRAFALGLGAEVTDPLDELVARLDAPGEGWRVRFDPTLVRGMGYYTGMVFEVEHPAYGYALAGGGRYDEMIGRFLGRPLLACGFSIGFERLVLALSESREAVLPAVRRLAVLAGSLQESLQAQAWARSFRAQGCVVNVLPRRAKRVGKQAGDLRAAGFEVFSVEGDQVVTLDDPSRPGDARD
jgi:histidyl-tRNA synthetase